MTDRMAVNLATVFILAMIVFILVVMRTAPARDLDGRYADSPFRAWFQAQLSPKTGESCCNNADGVIAEEDIRNGQYWTRWSIEFDGKVTVFPWMPVPDDVVLRGPNVRGRPVVWWYTEDGHPIIRCYAPGPLT